MQRLIEIRSYQLKPGAGAEFHAAVETTALPMLREWGTDVVAYGPSGHAPDTYYLIRAYENLDDLNRRHDAFYGSEEGRKARAKRSCRASRATSARCSGCHPRRSKICVAATWSDPRRWH